MNPDALWLKDTSTTPPEGWHYLVKETNYDVRAPNYNVLHDNVRRHCASNEVPVPSKADIDLWLCQNVTTPCYEGKHRFVNHFTQREAGQWPFFLAPMRLLATQADRGLGDVVGRIIGPLGGTAFETWHLKTFGKPCSCGDRRATLNARYPL